MLKRIPGSVAVICLTVFSTLVCRTADKALNVCEQTNRECHQRCVGNNNDFSQAKFATQSVSLCDQRCDKTYQSCVSRQKDKSLQLPGAAEPATEQLR